MAMRKHTDHHHPASSVHGASGEPARHNHEEHQSHGGHDHGHGGHDHGHGGHGDHVAMFRRRFWWSLLLTIPLVVTSEMVMDWFGYELDFPGIDLVGPV